MNGLVSTTPVIKRTPEKWLVGIKKEVSVLSMDPVAHWKEFMQRRKEVLHAIENEYYSVQEYGKDYSFATFNPAATFMKWAAIAVEDKNKVPSGMEALRILAGSYAVFTYRGAAKDFSKAAQYIFMEWLPNSGYELDLRPHYELLGEKYLGATNPNSEEEVWIPIKK